MKSFLFCVCAFVLCAFVMGENKFTPAELPCDAKLFYTEVFDNFTTGTKVTRIFNGFLAFYGRYMTQHEVEEGINSDVFGVLRVDMHDPKDPNTAQLYFGVDRLNTTMCVLYSTNPLTDLYRGLGFERGYFLDEFSYNSTYSTTFKGESCTAYKLELGNDTKIWYISSENRTLGYEFQNATIHRIWNGTYQMYAQYKDFRMPTKFPGCPDKVYENVESEPKCTLSPDSSSSSSTHSASSTHSSGASTLEITFATFMTIAVFLLAVF